MSDQMREGGGGGNDDEDIDIDDDEEEEEIRLDMLLEENRRIEDDRIG